MSDTIWTPLRYNIIDPLESKKSGATDEPKWCDGTAFSYPTDTGKQKDKKLKARPLTLTAYNQINKIRNAVVSESVRDEWLATDPLTAEEIKTFKEDIDEWQYRFDWQILPGDEKYFHKKDINDLRRLATYPNTKFEQPVGLISPLAHSYCIEWATKGMMYLIEQQQTHANGWQAFVDTVRAPIEQSHGFWLWTQYPEYGLWRSSTVGIIGLDGKIKSPLGGNYQGIWMDQPITTGGDPDNWWLIRLVQDVHTSVKELETAKKPLKGQQRFMTDIGWAWSTCDRTCGGGFCDYFWEGGSDSTCAGPHSFNGEVTLPYGSPRPFYCHGELPNYHSYTWYYAPEDEGIETGLEFFRTWEHYMDDLDD